MPLFLCPSPLLFIQPHSLHPFIPPSHPLSLPPADDTWCDGDWLRESQREETAGMGLKRRVLRGEGRSGKDRHGEETENS